MTTEVIIDRGHEFTEALYGVSDLAPDALATAQHEARDIGGIATPESIRGTLSTLGAVALGNTGQQAFISGSCSEKIALGERIANIARRIKTQETIIKTYFPTSSYASRVANQNFKPRSSDEEEIVVLNSDGTETTIIVPSYKGHGISGDEPVLTERKPEPRRFVEAAIQAKAIKEHLPRNTITAHEALLIPYEAAMITVENEKLYLTTSEIVWVGERTRYFDISENGEIVFSPQVELLSTVENVIGIKVGPHATAEEIELLAKKLNPANIPGKLIYTLRFGVGNLYNAGPILDAIQEFAPGCLIMSDPMHGNTYQAENGYKTRAISDIQLEIAYVEYALQQKELVLHGLHLEANGLDDTFECVASRTDVPSDKSLVDPELSNNQLHEIMYFYKNIKNMSDQDLNQLLLDHGLLATPER